MAAPGKAAASPHVHQVRRSRPRATVAGEVVAVVGAVIKKWPRLSELTSQPRAQGPGLSSDSANDPRVAARRTGRMVDVSLLLTDRSSASQVFVIPPRGSSCSVTSKGRNLSAFREDGRHLRLHSAASPEDDCSWTMLGSQATGPGTSTKPGDEARDTLTLLASNFCKTPNLERRDAHVESSPLTVWKTAAGRDTRSRDFAADRRYQ